MRYLKTYLNSVLCLLDNIDHATFSSFQFKVPTEIEHIRGLNLKKKNGRSPVDVM